MSITQNLIERARANKQRIVLPEALEERTLTAADKVLTDGFAEIILIGNPDAIHTLAAKLNLQHIDKAEKEKGNVYRNGARLGEGSALFRMLDYQE